MANMSAINKLNMLDKACEKSKARASIIDSVNLIGIDGVLQVLDSYACIHALNARADNDRESQDYWGRISTQLSSFYIPRA